MKAYTFEEMKEMFGVGWVASYTGITEVFVGADNRYHIDATYYETPKQALHALLEKAQEDYRKEVKRVDGIVRTLSERPWYTKAWYFVFKNGWELNSIIKQTHAKAATRLNAETERLYQLKPQALSRDDYKLAAPKLDEGQTVYVSVTQNNHLEVGVYAGKVKNLEYFLSYDDKNTLYYQADLEIDGAEDLNLRINNQGELYTGFTYHKVHLNKQEAVDRVKGYLEKQMNTLQEQLKKMEVSTSETRNY